MTTRVARAVLDGNQLTDVEVIFEALPRSGTSRHFAGRMEFDREGNLYVAVGDRGEMDHAQDTGDDAGGVHRITTGESLPNSSGSVRIVGSLGFVEPRQRVGNLEPVGF